MFTWLNKQGVEGDEGFSVQCISRYAFEYREGNNILTLRGDIGMCAGKACFIFDGNSISHWDNKPSLVPFSEEKKKKILSNFIAALKFQDVNVSY